MSDWTNAVKSTDFEVQVQQPPLSGCNVLRVEQLQKGDDIQRRYTLLKTFPTQARAETFAAQMRQAAKDCTHATHD